MPTTWFSLLSSAESSLPPDQSRRCSIRACHFLKTADAQVCEYHARFFAFPVSLTTRYIDHADIFKPRDDRDYQPNYWPALYLSPLREVFFRPQIRVVYADGKQPPKDPYESKDWGAIEAARRYLFADRERPKPGPPNRMSVGEVILPDGSVRKTVASPPAPSNRQQTGAFILWKGFGKKKIRKAQRNRPAGWHGNHPEQKPRDRWGSRETIDDLVTPAVPEELWSAITREG